MIADSRKFVRFVINLFPITNPANFRERLIYSPALPEPVEIFDLFLSK